VVDKADGLDLAGEAFRLHFQQIYRYLLRKTGNAHDAEELAQRVFVDAAARLDAGDPPESLLAWLYAVAERRFIDEIRRRARTREVADRLITERDHEAFDYGSEVARVLRRAMGALGEDSQYVVVKKLFEGRSFREIAREMGSTEAACKMRFSRAIRHLRDELKHQGLAP
jgi:RNA polymerase sigma-70 factor (ECF subfamily)